MGKAVTTYTDEDVSEGLAALLASGGSPSAAAEKLGGRIPVQTLSTWKNTTHAARYAQLEERFAAEMEQEILSGARTMAKRAQEVEAELLERVRGAQYRDVPQALRAVTDVKAKSIDRVLSLTGRPTDGAQREQDMGGLLKTLFDRGVIRVEAPTDLSPEDITDAEAVEDPS